MDAPRTLSIPAELREAIRAHARAQVPEEACGLIGGVDGKAAAVYPVSNQARSPVRFRMEPVEQLRAFHAMDAAGLDLIAIYHSHPAGPPGPSRTDLTEHNYPDVISVIADGSGDIWQLSAWLLDSGQAEPVRLV